MVIGQPSNLTHLSDWHIQIHGYAVLVCSYLTKLAKKKRSRSAKETLKRILMSEHLTVCTLGGVSFALDGSPVKGFTSRKAQALLIYLAYHERTFSREFLAELLWPERTQSGSLSNLRVALTCIRKFFRPFITITAQTVGINSKVDYFLDAKELDSRLSVLMPYGTDPKGNDVQGLVDVLELYHGHFLEGFSIAGSVEFDDWVRYERERLRQKAIEAQTIVVSWHLEQEPVVYSGGIEQAQKLLQLDPLHENAHRQLMLLFARSGQRNAALAQYGACRRMLYEGLGIEPEAETTQLYEQIIAGTMPTQAGQIAAQTLPFSPAKRIPSPTSLFIGRKKELAELTRLISDPAIRLVSIIAPGGMGKTRLAIEVAEQAYDSFEDGVFFVALEPLASQANIIQAIGEVVGHQFHDSDNTPWHQLNEFCAQKEMLLILDSCEHLLQEAFLVSDMLHNSPQVKILVTSREKLNLSGETVFVLGGMDVCESNNLESIQSCESFKLFLQGARQAKPGFSPTASDLKYVPQICRQIEGVPLGILLASAWVPALPLQAIAEEILTNLDFLKSELRDISPAHQSLRGIFDSSWHLLTTAEREIIMRLSVFEGGFTRGAATEVAGTFPQDLRTLANKSWLRFTGGDGRYSMHEMLRQYASERLVQAPEIAAETGVLHCAYFANQIRDSETEIRAGRQRGILADIENIRAGWRYALAHRRVSDIRSALEGLWALYEIQGWYVEAQGAFGGAAEALHSDNPSGESGIVYGRILTLLGWFTGALGERLKGYRLIQEGISILRQLDAQEEVALSNLLLARLAGEFADLVETYHEGRNGLEVLSGSQSRIASAHIALAEVANRMGDHEVARDHAETSAKINAEIGSQRGIAEAKRVSGDAAYSRGDYSSAHQQFQDSLMTYRELGYWRGIVQSLIGLGHTSVALDEDTEAMKYFGLAMDTAIERGMVSHAVEILLEIARLLIRQSQAKNAVEFAAFVLEYPDASAVAQETAAQIMCDAESGVAEDILQRAIERGRAMRLDNIRENMQGLFEASVASN